MVIKTILVPLLGSEIDKQTLDVAYQFARRCSAHLECVHVRPDPAADMLPMTAYLAGLPIWTPEMARSFQVAADHAAAAAREAFEQFCTTTRCVRTDQPVVSTEASAIYREIEGDFLQQVILEARVHDLVIVARYQSHGALTEHSLGELLVGCGRPLLLVGDKMPTTFAQHIAIAWKSTPEAARAVSAALPLLCNAERVAILSAQEEGQPFRKTEVDAEKLAGGLAWHGITAKSRCLMQWSGPPSKIVDEARDWGADLLVMGGYGHGRMRELVFGGFTREVLRQSALSVFMVH